jgi:hypothetical protein
MTKKKKLIEVALPLEAINKASAREQSIRHGHPNTLHFWRARRQLAAADGKNHLTDVADPETLLRLIQSVPSPQAELVPTTNVPLLLHLQENKP